MKIEIRNDLTVFEFNELRNPVGWNNKDINIVENAFKNSVIIKKHYMIRNLRVWLESLVMEFII